MVHAALHTLYENALIFELNHTWLEILLQNSIYFAAFNMYINCVQLATQFIDTCYKRLILH